MPLQVQNTLLPSQANILGSGGNLMQQLLSAQGGNNPFMPLSPEATGQWWNQYMRPEAENQFNTKVMPQVTESFVGPGTYWGGARAQAQTDARQNFENQQSQQIGNYYMQNRTLANQSLLPFALGLLNANTGIAYGQQQQQGGGMEGLGDMLRQLMQKQLGGNRQGQPGIVGANALGGLPGFENLGAPPNPWANAAPQATTGMEMQNVLNDNSIGNLLGGWGFGSPGMAPATTAPAASGASSYAPVMDFIGGTGTTQGIVPQPYENWLATQAPQTDSEYNAFLANEVPFYSDNEYNSWLDNQVAGW